MVKFISILVSIFLFLQFSTSSFAQQNSFVNVVNPIRGNDFWNDKTQSLTEAVKGQTELSKKYSIPVTWLLRYDALVDSSVTSYLKKGLVTQELGLFLEVTPSWTTDSGVDYKESESWHLAGSVFLTGYDPNQRKLLIQSAFEKFKKEFGYYPKSVGSWWIDAYSLEFMQKKYDISTAMIVADQFNTDNYQVWGQYWASPYYPTKKNTLFPAQNLNNKIPVVITQWASRDPINGYGSGVQESTYSLQVNDYIDYHDLDKDYFSKLIDIFTKQPLNQVNQVVVGIENSYSWNQYKKEYEDQLLVLSQKRSQGQIKLTTLKEFGEFYKNTFPSLSPTQVIVAEDPLGTDQKAIWFMNPYHRVGWFFDKFGSRFRDIRSYNEGQEEPCYRSACSEMKVTSYITRVLDEITLGKSLLLDQGKITNFKVGKVKENISFSYQNEAGRERTIDFMPRDIAIDGSIRTIDGTILYADSESDKTGQSVVDTNPGNYSQNQIISTAAGLLYFIIFLVFAIIIPGFVLVRFSKMELDGTAIFMAVCVGMVLLTLMGFGLGYFKLGYLIHVYSILGIGTFFIKKFHKDLLMIMLKMIGSINILLLSLIILGTFFQTLALVRSGWVYDFGMGFWGPLGHDLVWHQALINQLVKQIPPDNPIFSGQQLLNYHYFYDLLVALTHNLTRISVVDLIYRLYPVLFSVLLGVGTYLLAQRLFANKLASYFSVYFVYFAGSFGWIADYIKYGKLSGESAFWANQSVSFNLNPPFAISLVLMISAILLLQNILARKSIIGSILMVLLVGSLIEFKSYAGVLILAALLLVSLQQIIVEKSVYLFKIFIPSLLLSAAVFLPQNNGSQNFMIFSPFWFIHSMVDYSDRIGWLKLSQARQAYFERGDSIKFLLAEILGLVMFVIGNLGVRFMGFFQMFHYPANFYKLDLAFINYLAIISIAIPVFFIQKGNSWNTIQFMYYGLYVMSLLSGYVVYRLQRFLPKTLGLLFIVVVILLTPINSIDTFKNGLYKYPPSRLSHAELKALDFLKKQPSGIVLTYPFDKNQRAKFQDPYKLLVYETTSYVSAFSGNSVYMEDEIQHEIFLNNYKKRIVSSYDFFNRRDYEWSAKFLKENNIKYLYLPKLYKVELDVKKLNLEKIFENKEVLIYKVN